MHTFFLFVFFFQKNNVFLPHFAEKYLFKALFEHKKHKKWVLFFLCHQRRQLFPASYETPSNQSFQNYSPRCSKHSLSPGGEPLTSPPPGVGSGAHLWLVLSAHKRGHNHRLQTQIQREILRKIVATNCYYTRKPIK